MNFVSDEEIWENLANAIVLNAVKDYRQALLHLKRNPDSRKAKRAVKRVEKFFYSSWFEILTDLAPSVLIRMLKEEAGVS